MAIFYKHIKGCGSNTTSNDSGYWSWIEWSNSTTSTPKIYTKNSNDTTGRTDLGNIITSNATNQSVNQNFKIKQGCTFNVGDIKILNTFTSSTLYSSTIEFTPNCYIQGKTYSLGDNRMMIIAQGGLTIGNKTLATFIEKASFTKGLKSFGIYAGTDPDYVIGGGVIKADDKCEALYFNATSDRRAKSNITPLSTSALSIVKSLPIYTFNYTSKPEETTIGLIAQEAAEHKLDSFNMVDNLTATGENNDFMQMKESKLVYVLWKAVQELSAEVESLKEQLASK
jgi:hypothetical protein